GGKLPKGQQFIELVVAALHSVLMHEPRHPRQREMWASRQKARAHDVIATGMVPEIRQRAHAQRAYIRILVITHQRSDLPAIHALTHPAFDQRSAIGREPDVMLGIRKFRHPDLLM